MCITGEAGGFQNHFGAEKKKEKKTGSNVATFQRHDVSTSRHLVNIRKSQRTSQLRVIATLRRRNIAMSSRFLPHNHKKQRRLNLEASKNVRTGARKTEQQRLESLEKTVFCIFFLFS